MLSLSSLLLRPHPPVCAPLPDFPFGYTESPCHSMTILTATQTFPTLTTRHCMIATCSTPRVPMTAYPVSFAIGPNHRLLTTGLMTLIKLRRFNHMFALAAALILAHPTIWDFYFRAFTKKGHPSLMSDITTEPKWELLWQDFHLLV